MICVINMTVEIEKCKFQFKIDWCKCKEILTELEVRYIHTTPSDNEMAN